MLRQGCTLIIVPSEGHNIRRFRLRSWLVIFLILVIGGLGGAGYYYGQDYLRIKQALPNVDLLQKENHHQKAQILAFTQKIGQLKNEMEELTQFNKKIKTVLSLSDAPGSKYIGRGGADGGLKSAGAGLARQRKKMIRRMHGDLNRLGQEISVAGQVQQELHAYLESRKSILAATPSIWPARGWTTSGYGWRRSPFTGRREFHKGQDIANRVGTPIIAPAAGIVAKVGWESGYGRCVVIHHGYGLVTRYAHLKKFLVKPGQRVTRRQKIALMGSSGRSTGSHLHYEVWLNGKTVNPSTYLLGR